MSKVEYVGPRVSISNHGVTYRESKEDKYVYLTVALEILKDIDNDYEKKPLYTHHFENSILDKEILLTLLKSHENDIELNIEKQMKNYEMKIEHEIEQVQSLPSLTDIDKEVWIKNIEIMKDYRMQRAMNKCYYEHCIQAICNVIRHKKIKEVITPFNKNFFHVLNSIKGMLITGNPSINAKVTNEIDKDNNMIEKLSIYM